MKSTLIFSTTAALVLMLAWLVTGGTVNAQNSAAPAQLPEIKGDDWINSKPLKPADLSGKVVMVEFWTFGCYNCRNVEPYIKQWHSKFAEKGLTILAVHSPEFSHERDHKNVQDYVAREQIHHPVIIDNSFTIWKQFANRYWPVVYLYDKQGKLRYQHIGEGQYRETERWIQNLLAEPG